MSSFCGDLRQVAFVVRDADAMMMNWSEVLGVGPWFVRRAVTFDNFRYMGKPSPTPVLTLAFAQSGPLQIEVIQQHNDVPSGYLDFHAAGGNGFQHAASWFAERDAFEAAHRGLEARGLECVHEGFAGGLDVRFAYFRTPGKPAAIQMEIAEALNPIVRGFQQMMQEAAASWDGRDPIREIGTVPTG